MKHKVACPHCGHENDGRGGDPCERCKQPVPDTNPDYTKTCENCGRSPVVPSTELCGVCTFGSVLVAEKWEAP